MKRRHILSASLAAGLAGCVVGTSDQSTSTVKDEATSPGQSKPGATATPVEDDPPTYQPSGSRSKDLEGTPFVRARIATMPEPVPFQPELELIRQPATDAIGKLRVGMTNRSSQSWGLYGSSPNPYDGGSSDTGLRVGYYGGEIEDGCPRGTPVADASLYYDQVPPRQSISSTYQIYVTHDRDICFPTGEHRFSGYNPVYESRDDEDPALKFEWWFTLVAE